jgi:hypothetical protein
MICIWKVFGSGGDFDPGNPGSTHLGYRIVIPENAILNGNPPWTFTLTAGWMVDGKDTLKIGSFWITRSNAPRHQLSALRIFPLKYSPTCGIRD